MFAGLWPPATLGGDLELIRRVGSYDVPVDRIPPNMLQFTGGAGIGGTVSAARRPDAIRACHCQSIPDYRPPTLGELDAILDANGDGNYDNDVPNIGDHTGSWASAPILTQKGDYIRSTGELAIIPFTGPRIKGGVGTCWPKAVGDDAADKAAIPGGGEDVRGRVDVESTGDGGKFLDMFTFVPPDYGTTTPPPSFWRVYGRVNLNTAPEAVLRQLPWPSQFRFDGQPSGWTIDYFVELIGTPRRAGALQRTTLAAMFGSHLQPATPLDLDIESVKDVYDYLRARSQLYGPISDITTVGSDTFAVAIKIELYEEDATPPAALARHP